MAAGYQAYSKQVRPFRMKLSSLLERDPLLVSFDVFDTLLLRRVEQPADLFERVGERAAAAGLIDPHLPPYLFRLARQEAERRARGKVRGGEVELTAIHAELDPENPASLAALELMVETEQVFANPLLRPVLAGLKAAGVPVVLLSDMYLPAADLARLLAGAGIPDDLFRCLYVSATEGCSKTEGGLFQRLLADHPGIAPSRILHVGDDPLGDVAMARAAGLQAIHYVPSPGLARLRERERGMTGLVAAEAGIPPRRLAALAGREDGTEEAFALEFGSLVLGPAVAEYCRWVVEQCRHQGIRRIAPLMREAALFVPLMRNWIAHRGYDIEVEPLYVSRQALMPLELTRLDATAARRILGERPHLSWDRLLIHAGGKVPAELQPLAGLTLEQLLALATETGNPANLALSLFDDPELQARAARLAAETRKLLVDHVTEVLGDEGLVALVDLGARASTPRVLVHLLPEGRRRCRIFLAYAVADVAAVLADGIQLQVFGGSDRTGMALGRILYRSPQILERVLTGLEGTTLGYRWNEEGRVEPLLADPPARGEEAHRLSLLRQGIRRYADLMPAVYPARGAAVTVGGAAALLPLTAALLRPTVSEARFLGDLAYDQNDGTEGQRVICDATAVATVRPLAEMGDGPVMSLAMGLRPALAPWPSGTLTLMDPGILQRRVDFLGLEGGHGPVCRALLERLQGMAIRDFAILAVGGDGGMGPDFIRCVREAGLEPAGYADLMDHFAPPPLFHGVPVRRLADMPVLSLPLVLATLGYAGQLAALMRHHAAANGLPPPSLIALGRTADDGVR
jgi:FMN phosphatase YigB (HAD superfamily)